MSEGCGPAHPRTGRPARCAIVLLSVSPTAAFYRASGLVLWHFSDLPTPLTKVGYQGKSGVRRETGKE
jgi:hypothetical protein